MKPFRITPTTARKFISWLEETKGARNDPGPHPHYQFARIRIELNRACGEELFVLYENTQGSVTIPTGELKDLYQEWVSE